MKVMRKKDIAAALSIGVSEAVALAVAAVAAGTGVFALVAGSKEISEREEGQAPDGDDARIIARAVEDALGSGATTPEGYALEMAERGFYVCYRRESDGRVSGSSYGVRGKNRRYSGSIVGYPWGRVAERLGIR